MKNKVLHTIIRYSNNKLARYFITDKENQTTLKFHRKSERNVKHTDLKISLTSPVPLAYACLENTIGTGESILVKVEHINKDEKPPNSFHLRVGLTNKRPLSNSVLDFSPSLCIKIEKDECLGDLFVCISRRGHFHVCKDESCIDTKAIPPGMDPKLPMYVCFEIFRVRIELMGTLYCKHSDAMQYPKDPSQENESFYAIVEMIQKVDEDIRTGKITPEVQKKFTEGLTDYANHISVRDRSKSVYQMKGADEYLTPTSTGPIKGNKTDMFTLKDVWEKLEDIQKRIKDQHLERHQDCKKILEAIEFYCEKITGERKEKEMNSEVFKNHLRSTCAGFIANVDCFPLCDHLLQTGIFHQHQYETILDEHKQNRQEARRSLFSILLKKEYTPEQLRNLWAAFRDTKQETLLPKLGSS